MVLGVKGLGDEPINVTVFYQKLFQIFLLVSFSF